jgi:hypothetical protein
LLEEVVVDAMLAEMVVGIAVRVDVLFPLTVEVTDVVTLPSLLATTHRLGTVVAAAAMNPRRTVATVSVLLKLVEVVNLTMVEGVAARDPHRLVVLFPR